MVSDIHREADRVAELRKGDKAIGTTLQGIGPSYSSKINRFGLRMGDMYDWDMFLKKYDKFVEDAKYAYHVEEFDKAKELDTLKQLREKLVGGGMIIDSIEYMS